MVHGWPPSPCATERVISLWGTLCHHVESGVSRFILSTLSTRPVSPTRRSLASTTGGPSSGRHTTQVNLSLKAYWSRCPNRHPGYGYLPAPCWLDWLSTTGDGLAAVSLPRGG